MSHLLEVKGLTTSFKGDFGTKSISVDHVSFHVDKGETICIVGESGCGKSVTSLSLMRLLSRSGEVTEGSVLFDGQDLFAMTEKELDKVRGNKIHDLRLYRHIQCRRRFIRDQKLRIAGQRHSNHGPFSIPGIVPEVYDDIEGCRFAGRCRYYRPECDKKQEDYEFGPGHTAKWKDHLKIGTDSQSFSIFPGKIFHFSKICTFIIYTAFGIIGRSAIRSRKIMNSDRGIRRNVPLESGKRKERGDFLLTAS